MNTGYKKGIILGCLGLGLLVFMTHIILNYFSHQENLPQQTPSQKEELLRGTSFQQPLPRLTVPQEKEQIEKKGTPVGASPSGAGTFVQEPPVQDLILVN